VKKDVFKYVNVQVKGVVVNKMPSNLLSILLIYIGNFFIWIINIEDESDAITITL